MNAEAPKMRRKCVCVCVYACLCKDSCVCVCVSTRLSGNKISLNLTKLQANKKDEEDGGHLSL